MEIRNEDFTPYKVIHGMRQSKGLLKNVESKYIVYKLGWRGRVYFYTKAEGAILVG